MDRFKVNKQAGHLIVFLSAFKEMKFRVVNFIESQINCTKLVGSIILFDRILKIFLLTINE